MTSQNKLVERLVTSAKSSMDVVLTPEDARLILQEMGAMHTEMIRLNNEVQALKGEIHGYSA